VSSYFDENVLLQSIVICWIARVNGNSWIYDGHYKDKKIVATVYLVNKK